MLPSILFIFSGLLIGALLVYTFEGSPFRYILGISVLITVVVLMSVIRRHLIKQKRALETSGIDKGGSDVGFVVDTFHDLVVKLKEKEKELERLKAFAEEKAVRMEVYNENILQSVPSGVISIDSAMRIKSINQAAERILGVNSKEVIDKHFKEAFREPLTSLITDDRTIVRGEYQYITPDNRHIWLGITTSQLKNATGDKIGLIFVFTDLTDIKALQAQVELKQRLSQLGEMSAGIAHELRNSMSVISGYAKLLSRKVEEANLSTVEAILKEVRNMDRIISELLAFAKPTVLHKKSVDLNRVIDETVEAVISDKDNIKVSINAVNQIIVEADEVLLRQTFTNLFSNSIEAMPEGGRLEIDLKHYHDRAEILVKDTGLGIPQDVIQKIFLPFYTTKPQGTGLGLALVQKIIVSHGGSIEVESKEGEGTSFRIILPVL
jgi:PAS domain S-box-containing protein